MNTMGYLMDTIRVDPRIFRELFPEDHEQNEEWPQKRNLQVASKLQDISKEKPVLNSATTDPRQFRPGNRGSYG